jgi:hypothetical protein
MFEGPDGYPRCQNGRVGVITVQTFDGLPGCPLCLDEHQCVHCLCRCEAGRVGLNDDR